MNPNFDKTFIYMKNIARKKYNSDNFERIKEGKFVEDSQELSIVGKEIIDSFNNDKTIIISNIENKLKNNSDISLFELYDYIVSLNNQQNYIKVLEIFLKFF